MELAGSPALGAVHPVNCEFCGTPVLPGVKLCGECRAALKRARHDPASVAAPLAGRGSDTRERRQARKAARAAKAAERRGDEAAVIPPPIARRRSTTPALVGVLLAAICIVGYAMLQLSEHAPPPPPAPEPAIPTLTSVTPAPASAPTPAPVPEASAPVTVEPLPKAAPPKHPSHVQRKLVLAPSSVPTPITAPGPMLQPLPVPVLPKPVAPPDRRVQLQQRFARCVNSDILAQAFCEQRARIELCDGLWGTVPQCPPQRDYGN